MVLSELHEIARRNGGLVSVAQAADVGIAGQRLTELVRRGVIARVARGVYSMGNTPANAADPRVVSTACNVVVSHESAAAWFGVDLPEPIRDTHVTAPRNRGRRADSIPGARLHRASLADVDVATVSGIRVTRPLRTALDIARHASIESAVAIVDAFMRAKLVRPEEFAMAAQNAQGPGRVRIQLVASLVDPRSGSILESLTRVLMWRRGLPAPTSQFPFCHPQQGLIGYVDFSWPQLKAILECDGYEYHSARGPFQKDRRRWSAIGSTGWHLVVVTWFDVTCDPDYVIGAVQDLLALERGSCTQQ
jgi:predicted transcriptional regulator of viral defense system